MKLKEETFNCLKSVAGKEKFSFFFKNLKRAESPLESAMIDEIADLLIVEFGLDWKDQDKVRFFIRLGFLSNEFSE